MPCIFAVFVFVFAAVFAFVFAAVFVFVFVVVPVVVVLSPTEEKRSRPHINVTAVVVAVSQRGIPAS